MRPEASTPFTPLAGRPTKVAPLHTRPHNAPSRDANRSNKMARSEPSSIGPAWKFKIKTAYRGTKIASTPRFKAGLNAALTAGGGPLLMEFAI